MDGITLKFSVVSQAEMEKLAHQFSYVAIAMFETLQDQIPDQNMVVNLEGGEGAGKTFFGNAVIDELADMDEPMTFDEFEMFGYSFNSVPYEGGKKFSWENLVTSKGFQHRHYDMKTENFKTDINSAIDEDLGEAKSDLDIAMGQAIAEHLLGAPVKPRPARTMKGIDFIEHGSYSREPYDPAKEVCRVIIEIDSDTSRVVLMEIPNVPEIVQCARKEFQDFSPEIT